MSGKISQGFIQRGGGGALGSPPPRIPKVVTVLLINRYNIITVGIAIVGQTILKSTLSHNSVLCDSVA